MLFKRVLHSRNAAWREESLVSVEDESDPVLTLTPERSRSRCVAVEGGGGGMDVKVKSEAVQQEILTKTRVIFGSDQREIIIHSTEVR